MGSPRVAYRGFLSYSHKDGVAAAKLHRRLETYRLPKLLVAEGKPERLTPIFRDRDELSAGQDLSAQVQDALCASDALIILCSPNARASKWVNKEIETFRALHPGRPILAAIISGEPADAFPEALTALGHEPIAADLRKGKDGVRLGQLKLIAGIADVPLDALVQRDAQRQLRRVTAITVGALIAMLVMALLLVAALRARAEADRQRAEAEGLVEYMLTDLREKLIGVGRLDVLSSVNERALSYYEDQGDLDLLPAESLDRRARVIGAMATVDGRKGNAEAARRKYLEVRRTTAGLLARAPRDPDRIFAHARSENSLAVIANESQQSDVAIVHQRAAQRLLDDLLTFKPNKPEWLQMASFVNGNLCASLIHKKAPPASILPPCAKAAVEGGKLLAHKPDDPALQYDRVFQFSWLSDAWLANRRFPEAKIARGAALQLSAALIKGDPHNMQWREQQMENAVHFAQNDITHGQCESARHFLKIAQDTNDMLVKKDDQNAYWKEFRLKIENKRKDIMKCLDQ